MLIGRSTKEKVQYLIDAQINPGVAEHGGAVQVVEVKDGSVYLRLHGGCQGCGAADFTLKQGIETIVKRAVPEIQQDHRSYESQRGNKSVLSEDPIRTGSRTSGR